MTLAAVATSAAAAAAAAAGSIACCFVVEQRRSNALDAQRAEIAALCKGLHSAPGLPAATSDSVLLEEIKELRMATGMFHEVLARLADVEKRSDGALLQEIKSLRKGLHEVLQQRPTPGSSEATLLEEFRTICRDVSAEMRVVMERWDDVDVRRAAAPVAGQAPASAGLPAPADWCLKQSQEIPLVGIPGENLDVISGRLDHSSVDTANHILYLACLGSHCVLAIDTFAGKVVETLTGDIEREYQLYRKSTRWSCSVPSIYTPQGVLYVAATEHLYVASASGNVHIYSTWAGGASKLLGVLDFDGEVDNLRYFDGHVLVGYGDGCIGRIIDQPGLQRWDAHTGESGDDSSSDGESSLLDHNISYREKAERESQRREKRLEQSAAMRSQFQEACLDMSKSFAVDEHPEGFEIEQTTHPHRERRIFVNVADKCQVQVLGYDSGNTLDRWQLPEPLGANYPMRLDEENGLLLLGVRKPAAASCVLALVS